MNSILVASGVSSLMVASTDNSTVSPGSIVPLFTDVAEKSIYSEEDEKNKVNQKKCADSA